jgi:RNA polymerase-interacting CarD/CdnL/TRCF family regulator
MIRRRALPLHNNILKQYSNKLNTGKVDLHSSLVASLGRERKEREREKRRAPSLMQGE